MINEQLTNVNYLFNVQFKPGDTVTYESRRYGKAEMVISKVTMLWKNKGFVIRYIGRPKYISHNRYYTYTTAITDRCQSLKLKGTK